MTRKRVFLAMAACLMFMAMAAVAQDSTEGVCCQNGISQVPQGQQCILLHRVGPGENLHILAAYYYGDARAWQRIYNQNKKAIGNPNRIRQGQILRIEIPPCWTPRFDLQEFIRIEEARTTILRSANGERPKIKVSRETVEPKVSLVEEEGGSTADAAPAAGGQPRSNLPKPAPPAAGATPVQIEE